MVQISVSADLDIHQGLVALYERTIPREEILHRKVEGHVEASGYHSCGGDPDSWVKSSFRSDLDPRGVSRAYLDLPVIVSRTSVCNGELGSTR